MLETASIALATFFATIGPLDVAAVFAVLTGNYDPLRRRLDPTAVSYWLKRDPPAEPKRYFRQY